MSTKEYSINRDELMAQIIELRCLRTEIAEKGEWPSSKKNGGEMDNQIDALMKTLDNSRKQLQFLVEESIVYLERLRKSEQDNSLKATKAVRE